MLLERIVQRYQSRSSITGTMIVPSCVHEGSPPPPCACSALVGLLGGYFHGFVAPAGRDRGTASGNAPVDQLPLAPRSGNPRGWPRPYRLRWPAELRRHKKRLSSPTNAEQAPCAGLGRRRPHEHGQEVGHPRRALPAT